MAKRKTIGNDPLARSAAIVPLYPMEQSADIVPMPVAAAALRDTFDAPPAFEPPPEAPNAPAATIMTKSAPRAVPEIASAARLMIGGNLEILGGDLGSDNRAIWPRGRDGRVGFVAPNGRHVDLARDLLAIHSWSDGSEHRYLSAVGWAWVLACLGGIAGAIVGGGLRLAEPRRMMAILVLADGSRLVARTDAVTVAGLQALVAAKA